MGEPMSNKKAAYLAASRYFCMQIYIMLDNVRPSLVACLVSLSAMSGFKDTISRLLGSFNLFDMFDTSCMHCNTL